MRKSLIFAMTMCAVCGAFAADTQNGSGENNGYKLVWEDLFDGTSLNRKHWNVEVNGDGGGNGELQFYVDNDRAVRVGQDENGNSCLILTATREAYGNKPFTSGRVNSKHKVYFTKGKIEASIKFPKTSRGLWPAFWMMGNDYDKVGWPRCNEIDILEMGHSNGWSGATDVSDRFFNGAFHWGSSWNATADYSKEYTAPYSLQDGEYHLFTLILDDASAKMYLDLDKNPSAQPYCQLDLATDHNAPNDDYNTYTAFIKDDFLIFNLAVGGMFPGIYNGDAITAIGPNQGDNASMYVNYVKVYQKETDATSKIFINDEEPVDPSTAWAEVGIDAALKNAAGFENGAIFDVFLLSDYGRGRIYEEKHELLDRSIDDVNSHWYIWENTGVGGPGVIEGIDYNPNGFLSMSATAGWFGAGYKLDVAGQYDFSHMSDESRLHIAFSTETNAPGSANFSFFDESTLSSVGAKFSIGDGTDTYPSLGKIEEKGKWLAIDISFADLRRLCPSFDPAFTANWNGNFLTVLFENFSTNDNIAIDAFYIYTPKPEGWTAPEPVGPGEFLVSDPGIDTSLRKAAQFDGAIYDVFVLGDAAREKITTAGYILHDYAVGTATASVDYWGDYGPTLEAGPGEITGVDNSTAYVSATNILWPNWAGGGFNYKAGGRYDLTHLSDDSRLHIAFSTETQLSGEVTLNFLNGANISSTPATFSIGTGSATALSVGDVPTKGNWVTLDISFADLKAISATAFEPACVAAWFGNLLEFNLNNGALGDNLVIDAFYIYSPKPEGYGEDEGDDDTELPDHFMVDDPGLTPVLSGLGSGSTFDLLFASDAAKASLQQAGHVVNDYRPEVSDSYNWFPWVTDWDPANPLYPVFVDWTTTEPGVDGHDEGYVALEVNDKGYSGATLRYDTAVDFGHLTETSRLHMAYRSENMPEALNMELFGRLKFVIAEEAAVDESTGAEIPALGQFAADGSWRAVDIALKDLLTLYPYVTIDQIANANFTGAGAQLTAGGVKGKNIAIDAMYFYTPSQSGIGSIVADGNDAPVEYYNLQGVRVDNPSAGFYIRRQGNKVDKVIIR